MAVLDKTELMWSLVVAGGVKLQAHILFDGTIHFRGVVVRDIAVEKLNVWHDHDF